MSIQAATAVSGYAAGYDQLQRLYEKSHESERIGRLIAEQQMRNFLAKNAEQREIEADFKLAEWD